MSTFSTLWKWLGLLSFMIICFQYSQAQNHSLQLKSGAIEIRPNLEQFASSFPLPSELVQQHYYRLIHFEKIPDQTTKNLLANEGITLLEYLPKNSFIAAIDVRFDRKKITDLPVYSVIEIPSTARINPRVFEDPIPAYNKNKEHIKLLCRIQKDISVNNAKEWLQLAGIDIIKTYTSSKTLEINVKESDLDLISQLPYLAYTDLAPQPGEPEGLGGRNLVRSNLLNHNGKQYDGTGIKGCVFDDGFAGPHVDFKNRTEQITVVEGAGGGTHGDMVAGIFGGAGNINPDGIGIAPGVFLNIENYYNSGYTMSSAEWHKDNDISIFNASYSNGCNAGYTIVTQTVDQNAVDNPSLINIYSAGNSGASNCGYGAGSVWGTITGGHKMAKNCITTANLFADGTLVPSSSRGPASDGRIKPDIAAFGQGQLSLDPNNQYDPGGGTSAASPTIAGLTAQLYQAYQEINNSPAPAALIKATLLNTAVDLGRPGPDFEYGWGQAHGGRALKLLERKNHLKDQITQGQQNTHTVSIPNNVDEVRLMLYWADKPASEAAARALVNNLDLKVTDLDGNINLPLVLDPNPDVASLTKVAMPGIDNLNNIEQVRLIKPAGGDYTITIDGTDIPEGPQEYWLLYYSIKDEIQITYPLAGDHLVPGKPSFIYWDAYQNTIPFRLDYSLDGGSSWETIDDNINPETRAYSWTPPLDVVANQARFRIFRGGTQFSETEDFSIVAQAQGLVFISACDDTGVTVSWNKINGVDKYIVWALGDTKMEPIDTTSNTVIDLDLDINQEQWISVSAYSDNGLNGRRALAIQYTPNNSQSCLLTCGSTKDLGIQKIITPSPIHNGCATSEMNVVIQLQNLGKEPVSGGTVYYSIDGGTEFSETFTGTIPPAQSVPFQFSAPATNLTAGTHTIQVRTENSEDQTTCNNSRTLFFRWIPGPMPFPAKEHFENYEICLMSNVCGPNYCTFDQNTWYNATNRQEDDSDWTVHAAENSRYDISPSTDRTKNTADGKFLTFGTDTYCGNREAKLLSPCIDLSTAESPFFRMDYFAVNSDEAQIRIDIEDENGASLGVSYIRFDNGNNNWQRHTIDLSAHKGQFINLSITGTLTGDDEYSIAIDNLEFYDEQKAPGVDIVIDRSVVCEGEPSTFTGVVAGSYNSLKWTISPNRGIRFINNTTDESLRPTIAFDQAGTYLVQLTASNANGTDTRTLQRGITVGEGLTLPHFVDFEDQELCDLRPICNVSCSIDNGWYNMTNNVDDDTDWRTINGSPFFGLSEPGIDHTTFQSTGQYLLLDSYQCEQKTATLQSGCLDFTNTIAPRLTFWAIKGGSSELYIDILSNGTLQTEIQAFTVDESNDEWIKRSVDLSAFAGQQVNIQIRGITGTSLNDRISLDDISIFDDRKAPEAKIKINTISCSNIPVYFEDRSIGNTNNWEWSFEPNTYTFTNGTKASDQNIFVQFAPGTYNVQLVASNADGSDTIVIDQAVVVNQGHQGVFRDNFSRTGTCERTETCAVYCDLLRGWINIANTGEDETDWRITNQNIARQEAPLSDHTFASSSGDMLLLTLKNECIDAVEGNIYSPCFDLTNAIDPVISFWYYLQAENQVTLNTSVLTNGQWIELLPEISSPKDEWVQRTIDLTPFVGQVITIRFEGKLDEVYPNFIAIDDVDLFTRNTRADPDFEIDAGVACTVAPIKLENKTLGYADSLYWEISPNTFSFVNGTDANSENPEVLFFEPNNYTIRLIAFNTVGSATETKRIDIFEAYPLPYVMDFEEMELCDDFNQCRDRCDLSQGWQNIREGGTGRNDWMTNKGYTFFLETGPSSDHTLGTSKGTYIYAHSFYCNDDVETEVISACVDLNDAIMPELSFWYHMYGENMGTLEVEILNQGNWEMLTAISGDQGTEWLESKVDLTDYIGQVISLRFRSKRGGQYSDIALDDIVIQERTISTQSLDQQIQSLRAFPNPTAGSFTLVWKGGQSSEVGVEIYDVRGQLLYSKIANDFQVSQSGTIRIEDLSLQHFEAGTYWIRLRSDQAVGVISIVKQ